MAKDYGGPPKLEPTSQRLTLIIGVSGLCILCYVIGTWHGRSAAATDNLAASQSGISTTWSDDDDNNNNNNIKNDVAAAAFTEKETKSGSEDVVPGTMSDPLVSDSSQPQQPQVVSNADDSGGSFPPCNMSLSEYTPCEDRDRGRRFNRTMLQYRERHCPSKEEMLQCLIPALPNYKSPFKWPESRDFAWYANIPHKELSIEKAVQNWIQVEGDRFKFPGGGTMFPQGADAYIDDINALIPLTDGSIRTAVDTGCGVASWGAYLLKRDIITMSFAPRDTHEAQVWFALERGVPAMLGVLGSKRLPYPSRAFDMAHCSRCLVPWFTYDGLYLTEVDRILRPGGYWILSGPPIRWKTYWQGWNRTAEDLSQEQDKIEEVAKKLCWSKVIEKGDLAIWQKPVNHIECAKLKNTYPQPPMCATGNEDLAWYKNLEPCITPLPEAHNPNEVAGGTLMNWPDRALAAPPRIRNGLVKGFTEQKFQEDNSLWKSRVTFYKNKNLVKELPQGLFRNVMDMNAGLGGFAAALIKFPVWVMNVVPADASPDTLGVIYERGFIGTYMDWCEAFSTYPRTYDLIHANGVISIYQDKCNVTDILLEMDRILRPQGKVIFRDNAEVLNRVKLITDKLRWEGQIYDNESGPSNPEKLLICRKSYWTAEQKQGRK